MTVKDLLGGTLISLSMAAIALVVNTLTMAAPRVNLLVSSAICLFLCGPLFLVMARRIGHRGPLLIYYIVLSVIFILMGYYFMPLYLIPVGVIGELLMVKGSYEKLSRILLLWTYHSFFNVLS
ncbi:MAG: MptD family putative ECF transporter S component, partial [Deltaproteobacteria bacterium]|nr:MptD family putative ECF transporter S component [Deltaproteobacteria bacterium]